MAKTLTTTSTTTMDFSTTTNLSYLNINKRVFCSKDSSDEVTNTGTTSLSILKASNYAKLQLMMIFVYVAETVQTFIVDGVWKGK